MTSNKVVLFIKMSHEEDIHLYCLSNGSEKIYPNNTLTQFQCKLPFPIEWKKQEKTRWYVALEAIGFDPNFSTAYLPKKPDSPSIILITTYMSNAITKKDSICAGLDNMPGTCSADAFDKIFRAYTSNELIPIDATKALWKYEFSSFVYYFQENINYNKRRYYAYIKNLESLAQLKINYSTDDFVFDIHTETDDRIDILTHTVLHNNLALTILRESNSPIETWKKIDTKRFIINGEVYIGYTVTKEQYLQINIVKEAEIVIPFAVKVKSSFIRDQIFNEFQEKDLVCFSPKFTLNSPYCFYEVETKNFLQLSNTTLDSLDFQLVDNNNKQLELREGIPTLIKLHFKKMDAFKKSFHVRISSGTKSNKNGNDMQHFTVRMPKTLYFNREWKVALSSILLPGRFCTFPEPQEIKFTYKHDGNLYIHKDTFPMRDMTKEDLIEYINSYFAEHERKLGNVVEKIGANEYEPSLEFKFHREGFFTLSEHACRVLGYGSEDFVYGKKRWEIKFKPNERFARLKMSYGINVKYYRPNYILAYSNIVEPTPINAEMTNILKVFQVSGDSSHMLYEFKHLEYHRLLNDIVDEIRIELRTHTGEYVRFEKRSTSEVIVNLLFSNY